MAASPVHAFRYDQPIPAPNQTKALLSRRRAFYPGERVSLSFRLPQGATLAAPLHARVVLTLHDTLGAKLTDLGEAMNRMAAALQRQVAELQEKGQFLQALLDAFPDGVRVENGYVTLPPLPGSI